MAQLELELGLEDRQPAGGQDLAGAYWLGFSPDTPVEEARARFLACYGQAPRDVRPGLGGLILAGPVPCGEVHA